MVQNKEKQTVFKTEEGGQSNQTPKKTSTGLDQNIAGFLCYLAGFVTGIVFIILEKENQFVRFHAMQSIIVFAFIFILGFVLGAIPLVGWILSLLLSPISLILWIYLMWKAFQNEWVKLPVIGDLAEKQINK